MEDQTIYRFYEDKDAEQVVRLFIRNRFYVGKNGRDMTADEFRDIQKKRGMLFAIVGERRGEIIAHLGAYPTGAQRVGKPWQVYMDSFLIDEQYRKHLFSLIEMYKMAILHIVKNMPRVTTMISEVNVVNKQSLFLQRQFGSFMISSQPDQHGQRELYNCSPGVYRFMMPSLTEKGARSAFSSGLLPTNKKKAELTDEIYEDRFCKRVFQVCNEPFEFLINVYSGHVYGVTRQNDKTSLRLDTVQREIRFENRGDGTADYSLECLGPERELLLRIPVSVGPDSVRRYAYPDQTAYVEVDLAETVYKYRFYAAEDVTSELPEPVLSPLEGMGAVETVRGEMWFWDASKRTFMEMWPCITAPFLTGGIVPNLSLGLTAECPDKNTVVLTEKREAYTLSRRYESDGQSLFVTTVMDAVQPVEAEPVFQLYLNDLSGTCDFYAQGNLIRHRAYDYERDIDETIAEIIYYNYTEEPYSRELLSAIELDFGGSRYRVTADRAFFAFGRYNYIAIRLPADKTAVQELKHAQGKIDLGTIKMEKIR